MVHHEADVDNIEESSPLNGECLGIGLSGSFTSGGSLFYELRYARQRTYGVKRNGDVGDKLIYGQGLFGLGYRLFLM